MNALRIHNLKLPLSILAVLLCTAAGWICRPAYAQQPCETGTPYVFRAGLVDESVSPPDSALRSAALSSALPGTLWKDFDDRTSNRGVGHTFTDLPAGIVRAELELRLLPHSDIPSNDTINIGLVESNRFAATFLIANLPGAGGTWSADRNGITTFTIALDSTHASLLAHLSSQRSLDIFIQDDTAVDYLQLRVWTCPPPVAASGLLHQALGNAHIETGADGSFTVSNVGSSGAQTECGSMSAVDPCSKSAWPDLTTRRSGLSSTYVAKGRSLPSRGGSNASLIPGVSLQTSRLWDRPLTVCGFSTATGPWGLWKVRTAWTFTLRIHLRSSAWDLMAEGDPVAGVQGIPLIHPS